VVKIIQYNQANRYKILKLNELGSNKIAKYQTEKKSKSLKQSHISTIFEAILFINKKIIYSPPLKIKQKSA